MSKTKRTKDRKTRKPKVSEEAVKTLRTLGEQESFYFYEDIGRPTGHKAKNLSEFLDKIKSVKLESLVFHLQRDDFPRWIEKTLGDSELAKKLRKISPSKSDATRMSICRTVEGRLKELRESSESIFTDDHSVVIVPSS